MQSTWNKYVRMKRENMKYNLAKAKKMLQA